MQNSGCLRLLGNINGDAGGDFNNYSQTGFYSFHGGPLHGPGDSVANKAYGILIIYKTEAGYTIQDCFWLTTTAHRSWRIKTKVTDWSDNWNDN